MNKDARELSVKQLLVYLKNFVECENKESKACLMKREILNFVINWIDDSANA